MTSNVVTYTGEVNIDNPKGKLLPYLTANVEFETEHHNNVLKVANAALRWYPSSANEVALKRDRSGSRSRTRKSPNPPIPTALIRTKASNRLKKRGLSGQATAPGCGRWK